jgi:PGF-pre-PGF domain-containing protein
MPKSCILFKSYSCRRKLYEKLEKESRKTWRGMRTRTCIIFVVFGLLLSLCGPVGAYYFPPVPSEHIVVEETSVSVSLAAPARTVFINVTEYDAKQIVKNVTVEFYEPVDYVSFTLKVLSKRPSYIGSLDNSTILHYYAITFSTGVTDEIANVKMDFAILKDAAQQTVFSEENLVLYRFDGEKMQECPTEKVAADDAFLCFKTNTEGSSYVVATGGISLLPWWFAVAVIAAAVALVTAAGIYGYRKSKLAKLRKMLMTVYGK